MRCFDTHCHYNLEPLYSGEPSHFDLKPDSPLLQSHWSTHWQTAQEKGVRGGIVVGTDLTSSQKALAIHLKESQLLPSVGIHPGIITEAAIEFMQTYPEKTEIELETYLAEIFASQLLELKQLAQKPDVIAIGECGCDYFHFNDSTRYQSVVKKIQARVFADQIQIANEVDLPLIVHVRDKHTEAYSDVLALIKQTYAFKNSFVLHCASGPLTYIQQAITLGGYVGFDGNLTYKNNQDLLAILATTPVERVLLETDAPYLPPVPYRGQVCEPWMVIEVAKYLYQTKPITESQLLTNTKIFFGPRAAAIIGE